MKKTIKKSVKKYQNSGPGLRAAADKTRVNRMSDDALLKRFSQMSKDKSDLGKIRGKYSALAFPDRESSFRGDSVRYYPGQRTSLGVPYIKDLGKLAGLADVSDKDLLKALRTGRGRSYQDTLGVKANPSLMSNQKNGGKTKKSMKTGGKVSRKLSSGKKKK